CATVLMRFPGRPLASVHLDFVQRTRVRGGQVAGDRGTVTWNLMTGDVWLHKAGQAEAEHVSTGGSFDETYREELRDFFRCVTTGGEPRVGLAAGVAALRVALRAQEGAGLLRDRPT